MLEDAPTKIQIMSENKKLKINEKKICETNNEKTVVILNTIPIIIFNKWCKIFVFKGSVKWNGYLLLKKKLWSVTGKRKSCERCECMYVSICTEMVDEILCWQISQAKKKHLNEAVLCGLQLKHNENKWHTNDNVQLHGTQVITYQVK